MGKLCWKLRLVRGIAGRSGNFRLWRRLDAPGGVYNILVAGEIEFAGIAGDGQERDTTWSLAGASGSCEMGIRTMHQVIEGRLLAGSEDRFAIVVSRFNDLVTRRLLEGAVNTLVRHGAAESAITAVWVPGSFELPVVADKLAGSREYAAVLALGAVIQGQTTHHEYINHAVANGLMRASQKSGTPVLFGVLTCATMEQALDRAGGKAGNKGSEAALAALETVDVLRKLAAGANAGPP